MYTNIVLLFMNAGAHFWFADYHIYRLIPLIPFGIYFMFVPLSDALPRADRRNTTFLGKRSGHQRVIDKLIFHHAHCTNSYIALYVGLIFVTGGLLLVVISLQRNWFQIEEIVYDPVPYLQIKVQGFALAISNCWTLTMFSIKNIVIIFRFPGSFVTLKSSLYYQKTLETAVLDGENDDRSLATITSHVDFTSSAKVVPSSSKVSPLITPTIALTKQVSKSQGRRKTGVASRLLNQFLPNEEGY
jgi:hypothetical protein